MTFTYVDPLNSDRDKVRFLIQDNSSEHYHLEDEEIQWLLQQWENVYDAAAAAADVIAGSYAHKADYTKTVGDLTLTESFGKQSERFSALANNIRQNRDRLNSPTWIANPQALKSTKDRLVETYKTDTFVGQFDNTSGSN